MNLYLIFTIWGGGAVVVTPVASYWLGRAFGPSASYHPSPAPVMGFLIGVLWPMMLVMSPILALCMLPALLGEKHRKKGEAA